MTAGSGDQPAYVERPPSPAQRPLTPGEALAKLFLDNADRGANAANDELVQALLQRAREIQALADPSGMGDRRAGPPGPGGAGTYQCWP